MGFATDLLLALVVGLIAGTFYVLVEVAKYYFRSAEERRSIIRQHLQDVEVASAEFQDALMSLHMIKRALGGEIPANLNDIPEDLRPMTKQSIDQWKEAMSRFDVVRARTNDELLHALLVELRELGTRYGGLYRDPIESNDQDLVSSLARASAYVSGRVSELYRMLLAEATISGELTRLRRGVTSILGDVSRTNIVNVIVLATLAFLCLLEAVIIGLIVGLTLAS